MASSDHFGGYAAHGCYLQTLKLVSLAIQAPRDQSRREEQLNFEDTVVWYPDIPDPRFTFIGTSGLVYGSSTRNECPVSFHTFCDPDGRSTYDFQGVSVRMYESSDSGIQKALSIAFRSDPLGTWMNRDTPLLGLQSTDIGNRQYDFAIDHAGGEFIAGLDVFHVSRRLIGFKVSFVSSACPSTY